MYLSNKRALKCSIARFKGAKSNDFGTFWRFFLRSIQPCNDRKNDDFIYRRSVSYFFFKRHVIRDQKTIFLPKKLFSCVTILPIIFGDFAPESRVKTTIFTQFGVMSTPLHNGMFFVIKNRFLDPKNDFCRRLSCFFLDGIFKKISRPSVRLQVKCAISVRTSRTFLCFGSNTSCHLATPDVSRACYILTRILLHIILTSIVAADP